MNDELDRRLRDLAHAVRTEADDQNLQAMAADRLATVTAGNGNTALLSAASPTSPPAERHWVRWFAGIAAATLLVVGGVLVLGQDDRLQIQPTDSGNMTVPPTDPQSTTTPPPSTEPSTTVPSSEPAGAAAVRVERPEFGECASNGDPGFLTVDGSDELASAIISQLDNNRSSWSAPFSTLQLSVTDESIAAGPTATSRAIQAATADHADDDDDLVYVGSASGGTRMVFQAPHVVDLALRGDGLHLAAVADGQLWIGPTEGPLAAADMPAGMGTITEVEFDGTGTPIVIAEQRGVPDRQSVWAIDGGAWTPVINETGWARIVSPVESDSRLLAVAQSNEAAPTQLVEITAGEITALADVPDGARLRSVADGTARFEMLDNSSIWHEVVVDLNSGAAVDEGCVRTNEALHSVAPAAAPATSVSCDASQPIEAFHLIFTEAMLHARTTGDFEGLSDCLSTIPNAYTGAPTACWERCGTERHLVAANASIGELFNPTTNDRWFSATLPVTYFTANGPLDVLETWEVRRADGRFEITSLKIDRVDSQFELYNRDAHVAEIAEFLGHIEASQWQAAAEMTYGCCAEFADRTDLQYLGATSFVDVARALEAWCSTGCVTDPPAPDDLDFDGLDLRWNRNGESLRASWHEGDFYGVHGVPPRVTTSSN